MSRLPQLAVRNVTRNKRRSAITLSAVVFGIASVVLMRGFMDGFQKMLIEDVVRGSTGAIQVHRAGYVGNLEILPNRLNMPYTQDFVARLRSVRGVSGVSGRILFAGMVSNGRTQSMFVGRAVDPAAEREACPRTGFDLADGGAPLAPDDYTEALVGWDLAKSLGAVTPAQRQAAAGKPGAEQLTDTLALSSSSPEGRSNAINVKLKGSTYSVTPFENKRSLTVPLKLAQDLLGLNGRVTEYAIGIENLEELDRVAADLTGVLGPEYEVHTWKKFRPFFSDVIRNQRSALSLVMFILFAIGLTGIINAMLMNVFERVREIGTMLALGVRRSQVLGLFLMEAVVLGLVGGVLGGVLGKAIVLALASKGIPITVFATRVALLRPEVDTSVILNAAIVAMVGALLSALYPAWKASRMNPVDALRSV